MSRRYICECCRAKEIRIAYASLEALADADASDATIEVAADELNRALHLLRSTPALRLDRETE